MSTVPTSNSLIAANVWEVWDLTLSLPAVLGDEAVSSVRAGYISQRSRSVVIAGVVRYRNGLSGQGEVRKPEG